MDRNADFPVLLGVIGMFASLQGLGWSAYFCASCHRHSWTQMHEFMFSEQGLGCKDRERHEWHSNESHCCSKAHLSPSSCIMAWPCPIFSCSSKKQTWTMRLRSRDRKRKASHRFLFNRTKKKKKKYSWTVTSKWGIVLRGEKDIGDVMRWLLWLHWLSFSRSGLDIPCPRISQASLTSGKKRRSQGSTKKLSDYSWPHLINDCKEETFRRK